MEASPVSLVMSFPAALAHIVSHQSPSSLLWLEGTIWKEDSTHLTNLNSAVP